MCGAWSGALDRDALGPGQRLGDHVHDRCEERQTPCSVGQQRGPVKAGQSAEVDLERLGIVQAPGPKAIVPTNPRAAPS
jgi:hypothetical protein